MNYFLIDVAQVYRVYMIWELAHNAVMCMKRNIVLFSWLITVELYVMWSYMSLLTCPEDTVAFWGHPCPVYFDS